MGATASKPARSAVSAASRRQYPKKASLETTKANTQQNTSTSTSETTTPAGPTYHSNEQASSLRSEAIDLDARDPHFAASLRSIGPVIPNPTFSNSSTFNKVNHNNNSQNIPTHIQQSQPTPPPRGINETATVFPDAHNNNNPALLVLSSRSRIAKAAEQELNSLGRPSHKGREFLDAMTIRQILTMRDVRGSSAGEIERLLGLKKGVVGRLGVKGVVSGAG